MSRASEFEKSQSRAERHEAEIGEPEVIEGESPSFKQQAKGALLGIEKSLPFGEAVSTKLRSLLTGETPQAIDEEAKRLDRDVPLAVGVGQVGGTLATLAAPGLGLAGKAAGAAEALGAGKVLAGAAGVGGAAAEGAAFSEIYKLGDIAQQAQLQSTPLRTEQLAHSLLSPETLYTAVLSGLLHTASTGVEAAGRYIAGAPKRQAAKVFSEKTATAMGGSREQLGQYALETGILKPGKVEQLKHQAGQAMEEAAAHLEPDEVFLSASADKLREFVKGAESNENLAVASKKLLRQADKLDKVGTGQEFEQIIQGMKATARSTKNSQKKAFWNDAAQTLRNDVEARLQIMNPDAGGRYSAAVHDYNVLSKVGPDATRGAAKQFTSADLGEAAGNIARNHVLGSIGGIPGQVAAGAADVLALRGLPSKNYATFLDAFSKSPPFANAAKRSKQAIQALMSPNSTGQVFNILDHDDAEEYYDQLQHTLRAAAVSPEPVARKLRSQLDFLPPHEADAVTAHAMDKTLAAAVDLPGSTGPATLSGVVTGPTDRQKREFIQRHEARFDPYKALASGRKDLIAEAERYNPEVMHALKQKAIEELHTRKDLSYDARRRLSALLGVPASPTQDPALAVGLQNVIQTKRAGDTQAGQIESTRQVHATMKNNKAALTRAQRIVGAGE